MRAYPSAAVFCQVTVHTEKLEDVLWKIVFDDERVEAFAAPVNITILVPVVVDVVNG